MAKEDNKKDNKQEIEERVSLDTFLDIARCKRHEIYHYMKKYGEPYRTLTIKEWSNITGLIIK